MDVLNLRLNVFFELLQEVITEFFDSAQLPVKEIVKHIRMYKVVFDHIFDDLQDLKFGGPDGVDDFHFEPVEWRGEDVPEAGVGKKASN